MSRGVIDPILGAMMTDGQLVALKDGTKAELKQVRLNAWQTVLVAVELTAPKATQPR